MKEKKKKIKRNIIQWYSLYDDTRFYRIETEGKMVKDKFASVILTPKGTADLYLFPTPHQSDLARETRSILEYHYGKTKEVG